MKVKPADTERASGPKVPPAAEDSRRGRPGPRGADVGTKRRAAALYESGKSTPKIAAEFGIGKTTVLAWLKELGVERRLNTVASAQSRAVAQQVKERAAELYRLGCSLEEVGRELGRSAATVHGWLQELGVERRPSVERKHETPVERECAREGCSTRFVPDNGHLVAAGYGKYCSPECFHLASRKYPEPEPRRCAYCGKWFTPEFPYLNEQRYHSASCKSADLCEPLLRTLAPRVRQKALGKVKGRKSGRLGGRPPSYTPKQEQRALELIGLKKLSDEAIGRAIGMSRRQVQYLRAKAEQNPF